MSAERLDYGLIERTFSTQWQARDNAEDVLDTEEPDDEDNVVEQAPVPAAEAPPENQTEEGKQGQTEGKQGCNTKKIRPRCAVAVMVRITR